MLRKDGKDPNQFTISRKGSKAGDSFSESSQSPKHSSPAPANPPTAAASATDDAYDRRVLHPSSFEPGMLRKASPSSTPSPTSGSPGPLLTRPSVICHTTVSSGMQGSPTGPQPPTLLNCERAAADLLLLRFKEEMLPTSITSSSASTATAAATTILGMEGNLSPRSGLFNTPPPTPPDLTQDFSGFQLLVDVALKRAAEMELQAKQLVS